MKKESKIFFLFFLTFLIISTLWGIEKFFLKKDFTIFVTEEEIPIQSDRWLDFFK